MDDVLDIAREVLGIGPFDLLPEENEVLTPEQILRFDRIMDEEVKE